MAKHYSLIAAVVAALTLTAAGAAAQADPARPISAGLLLGFGGALNEDFNPWGFGFGVQGGYNLDRLYLGGRFVYHIGTSEELESEGFTLIEVDFALWEIGVEVGYDFALAERVTLRPSVVVGLANLLTSTDVPLFSRSSTDAKFLLSLGATGQYDITDMFYAGAELRIPLALGGDSLVGLVFYALGGVRF